MFKEMLSAVENTFLAKSKCQLYLCVSSTMFYLQHTSSNKLNNNKNHLHLVVLYDNQDGRAFMEDDRKGFSSFLVYMFSLQCNFDYQFCFIQYFHAQLKGMMPQTSQAPLHVDSQPQLQSKISKRMHVCISHFISNGGTLYLDHLSMEERCVRVKF